MRKWEFSKKLAAWAVVVATLAAALSYALAALDKQSVSDVTTLPYLPVALDIWLHMRPKALPRS